MDNSLKNWIEKAAQASNAFEENNSDLKRRYIIRNIQAFYFIVQQISGHKGCFGTGYPFYALPPNLLGSLPIIDEQFRYNNELIEQSRKSQRTSWTCEKCLPKNYDNMPDLKQVCKPCPNMDDNLKPRKVINRLPDIDMWMICKDGGIEEAQYKLSEYLKKYNLQTSDVNPLQTIKDMEEISTSLQNGIMPKHFLPIDAHIIEYSKIRSLIEQVPSTLAQAKKENQIPYLPIHPKSYRKTWQYDDEAYNFIYDFLSAFTEFNFVDSLDKVLKDTRDHVVRTYSPVELYEFLVQSATSSNRRRFKTPELQHIFLSKMKSWRIERKLGESDGWNR